MLTDSFSFPSFFQWTKENGSMKNINNSSINKGTDDRVDKPQEKKLKSLNNSNSSNNSNNNMLSCQTACEVQIVPMAMDNDCRFLDYNIIDQSDLDLNNSFDDDDGMDYQTSSSTSTTTTTNTTTSISPFSLITYPLSLLKSIAKNNNNSSKKEEEDQQLIEQQLYQYQQYQQHQQQNQQVESIKKKINSFEELPLEIIVHIFSFLDYKDLNTRVSLVNKNIKEISEVYTIWKYLYYSEFRLAKGNKKKKLFHLDINSIYNNITPTAATSKLNNSNVVTESIGNNTTEIFKDYKQLYKKRFIVEKNWRRGICSVQTLYGHQDGVWGVQFHGDMLVSGCEDGVMKVWDINEGECLNTLIGHQDVVNSFHFEGDRIISGSDDSTLKMWNAHTGQCVNTFRGHQGSVWMLEFKDNCLVSGGDDKMVRVWDTNTGQLIQNLEGHSGRIYYVQMGNNLVVSGAQDRSCRVWDLRSSECVHSMTSNSPVHCLQINGDLWDGGDWAVASGHNNGSISIWNLRTGSLQAMLSNPLCCPVWHIQFRKNNIFTSSCNDLHSWNLGKALEPVNHSLDPTPTQHQLTSSKVFKGHTKSIKHFQVKDNRLVSGGLDNKIKVWDLDKPGNNYLYTLVGHTKSVDWLEFKKDKLISCSADHTIRIWDFYS
ncbi:hypothetical protein CYY_002181 [Polysphondylium violaceum]|uniref:F-box domain-containing protein n=1 Tax=Polysphondylium violaceum TaxID=133409 RepID=A0A8J4PX68_9MYCE|nr:hypothetical protein CYY_002181 [Polysphondylium violaceum]